MTTSTSDKPVLNVCPVGMDERSHQTLRMFFEHQLGGSCALSEEHRAHAVLLDLDGHQGKDFLDHQLRHHPDRPLILLSLDDSRVLPANAVLVKKPIRIGLLAEALRDLSLRLFEQQRQTEFSAAAEHILRIHQTHHRDSTGAAPTHIEHADVAALHLRSEKSFFHIGATPDMDLANPDQRSRVFYDPGNYLQGHFEKAIALSLEKRTVVRLAGTAFKHFDIHADNGKVVVPTAKSTLYAAGRMLMKPHDISIEVLADAPGRPPGAEPTESIDTLTWKLALWASHGRVPVGTDLDWPVFIKRWPNLTRLLAPPHATRIASLWTRQPPFSLAGTVTALDIPQRLVFAFYSACVATGIAAPTRRTADVLVAPEAPKANEKRSLFRLLLGKLMHDWSD